MNMSELVREAIQILCEFARQEGGLPVWAAAEIVTDYLNAPQEGDPTIPLPVAYAPYLGEAWSEDDYTNPPPLGTAHATVRATWTGPATPLVVDDDYERVDDTQP